MTWFYYGFYDCFDDHCEDHSNRLFRKYDAVQDLLYEGSSHSSSGFFARKHVLARLAALSSLVQPLWALPPRSSRGGRANHAARADSRCAGTCHVGLRCQRRQPEGQRVCVARVRG